MADENAIRENANIAFARELLRLPVDGIIEVLRKTAALEPNMPAPADATLGPHHPFPSPPAGNAFGARTIPVWGKNAEAIAARDAAYNSVADTQQRPHA